MFLSFISFVTLFFLFSCSSIPMVTTANRSSSKKPGLENTSSTSQRESILHTGSELDSAIKSTRPTTDPASNPDSAGYARASNVPVGGVPVSSKVKPEAPPRIISDKSFETDSRKIGIILPLTGKNSAISQRALAAIRLGLKINSNSDFSLALYDTQGSPELAAKGVEKLLQDDHVIAILGGLGAKEASAIASRAEFFQVPFFTFSQKSDLTNEAKYTFRNSVTPAMQTSKLVEFATQKLGYKRFAILCPNDAYGIEFANQFWDHVLAYGGSIVAAQIYDPKDVDLSSYIQKMTGTYYTENRLEEYKNKMDAVKQKKEKKKKNTIVVKKSRENEVKENILDPIVDFDAIFIPDNSKTMGQAIGFFKAADVTQMTYLGTNLWNTEDLLRRANQTAGNSNNHFYFVDNLITDEQRQKSDFNSQFSATYNEQPSIIEVQTYESAKILRDLIFSGARDRYTLTNRLKELGHLSGAFTEIYMNNSNEIVRDLSVFSLENGSILPQQ